MKHKILITYKDGDQIIRVVHSDDIDRFFSDINNGQVHIDKDTGIGFWTDLSSVKYIGTVPIKEDDGSEQTD